MKHRWIVSLASIGTLLILVSAARARSTIQGTYSCGFDSASGYQAPGTNTAVSVGGVFTLSIDKTGAISNGSATLSVDDGGAGPAVCTYASGTGAIDTPPFLGTLGSASLALLPDNGNSVLCPPGDGSLAFSPTNDGLQFIYTNAAGFSGQGVCGIQAVPSAATFQCTYDVKDKTQGTGSGLGSITFTPRLNQPPLFLNTRPVGISGRENYHQRACPYLGFGLSFFIVSGGGWDINPLSEPAACPVTPFKNPNFTTTAKTIFITAPGMSHASCLPSPTLTNSAAKIEVTPTVVNFESQAVGTTSPPQTIIVKNTGTDVLNLVAFATTEPFDQDPSACDSPLSPGQSCPVLVTFAPKRKGKTSGKMEIVSDGADKATVVKLGGSGN